MNNPTIEFHQPNLEYDTLRLLFTAHKLATGQYQYYNWLIAPTLPSSPPPNLIIFPDLPYTHIPQFWENTIQEVTPTTPPLVSNKLITSLTQLLSPTWSNSHNSNYQQLQSHWLSIQTQFWQTFVTTLPTYSNKIKLIHIYPTLYGTTKSFSLITSKTTTLHIYLRLDQDINSLIDGIISGTIRHQLQQTQYLTWTETEAIKDAFLTETPLHNFTSHYQSTLHATRSVNKSKLHTQSLTYLKHLGLDNANKWKLHTNHTISYHSQTLTNLTQQDKIILTTLIKTPTHSLTQHQLATALYPNPDKFSLWGLAKAIQRLRQKLLDNHLPAHLIQTHRNQGYSLYSAPTITQPDDQTF